MPAFDMSQKMEKESVAEYHDRPLFTKPSITQVISRHAGTVLVHEPHVKLHKIEQEAFDAAWEAVANGEGESASLMVQDFGKLLEKRGVHLGKDLYIKLVDDQLAHLKIDPEVPMSKHEAQHLYCKVYASPIQHGPRLRKAVGRADLAVVRELVERGCDLNTADGSGHTPLHHACFYGQKDAIKELAALSGKNHAAKLVVDAKDNSGWTPLMCAASNGHVDSVKALMDLKAHTGEVNLEGRNALHVAAGKGMDRIVKMLVGTGSGKALLQAESERGWTPLFDACLHSHEDVIKMLLKAGADTAHEDMLGFCCDKYCDEAMWARCAGDGARK
jgi:hypothetical protein